MNLRGVCCAVRANSLSDCLAESQEFQLALMDNAWSTKEPKLEIDGVRQMEMHLVERAKANPGLCIDHMLYRKVVVM